MSKPVLRHLAIVALIAVPMLGTGFAFGRRFPQGGYRLYQQVLRVVAEEAVDSLTPDSLYTLSAHGLAEALDDPFTELFNQRDFESFARNQLGNRYGGIGLRIVRLRDSIQVWRVIPGGPAEAAGVRRGDRIIQVGDSSTVGWTTDRTAMNLTGTPGTTVRVAFARHQSGERYVVDMTRAVISVSVVPFTTVLPGNIGYLPIQRFSDRSATDVAGALQRLLSQGATSYILDLRGNPGGSLDQAVAMTNLFVDAGRPIVTIKARRGDDTLRGARQPAVSPRVPVLILVDSTSASASEILAGALQDYDRALIVGTNTFGKGVVQGAYPLPDGWVLKLTTGKWFTPLGRPLQRTRADSVRGIRPTFHTASGRAILGGGGVTPDVIVFADTISASALSLARVLNTRGTDVNNVLDRYAGELESALDPAFVVTPAWRAELLRRLRAAGLLLPDTLDRGAGEFLDRLLERQVAGIALTDSAAFMRAVPRDIQLTRALALLRGHRSQAELFAAATLAPTGGSRR